MPYQLWDRDGHSARLAICFAEVVGVQLDNDSSESDSSRIELRVIERQMDFPLF